MGGFSHLYTFLHVHIEVKREPNYFKLLAVLLIILSITGPTIKLRDCTFWTFIVKTGEKVRAVSHTCIIPQFCVEKC
jgi:hypothetical protein